MTPMQKFSDSKQAAAASENYVAMARDAKKRNLPWFATLFYRKARAAARAAKRLSKDT
jgi:hypothetical protein